MIVLFVFCVVVEEAEEKDTPFRQHVRRSML